MAAGTEPIRTRVIFRDLSGEEWQAAQTELYRRIKVLTDSGIPEREAQLRVISQRTAPIVEGEAIEDTALRFGIIPRGPGLEERVAALEAITAKLTEPAILKDCRTDYFRDGLQGGAVRITHLPTGLTAEGTAKAGDLKDLARELAGDLGRMLEEPREATDKPRRSSPPGVPLSPGGAPVPR